jgi:hypothetical protein
MRRRLLASQATLASAVLPAAVRRCATQEPAEEAEERTSLRAKHAQRINAAAAEAQGYAHRSPDELERWWPVDNRWNGRMTRGSLDSGKKMFDGMAVPEVKTVPDQKAPEQITFAGDNFFAAPELMMTGEAFPEEMRFLPAPAFDPALDDLEEHEFGDAETMADISNAAAEDKRRLEALGNPMTAEDQMDMLLMPQREGQENVSQRQDFNGFLHWGLLKAADIAVDEEKDCKRAHGFINRYLRDVDLFQQWLSHPKVVKHIKLKFELDISRKFDKLIAMTMALYLKSKIQCVENDYAGALKSLVGAMGMLNETADMSKDRHRKALGAILSARGMVYLHLESPERAEEDLTRCMAYVPHERFASLYQLRAEAREQQGKLVGAREDELHAAEIWETGEVISQGMDHPPVKWVM